MQLIPFYLPQYHPIKENNEFWGEGFTEWTNVKKAKPLYHNHEQPKIPAKELGYYDLLDYEKVFLQEQMALKYGVYGFAYWHYWFGNGKMVLEKPLQNKLIDPSLKLKFCMAWANESWTGRWHGLGNEVILEQKYPGIEDYRAHFDYLLPFFRDQRYIKFEKQPLFIVHKPFEIPDEEVFVETFREEASKNGLPGIFLIESRWRNDFKPKLYDGAIHIGQFADMDGNRSIFQRIRNKVHGPNLVESYKKFSKIQSKRILAEHEFPVVFSNWDNTPRMGSKGKVLEGSTPELFDQFLRNQYETHRIRKSSWAEQFVFAKSWNEWAEGNYLEPDSKYGYQYLQKISNLMMELATDFLK